MRETHTNREIEKERDSEKERVTDRERYRKKLFRAVLFGDHTVTIC